MLPPLRLRGVPWNMLLADEDVQSRLIRDHLVIDYSDGGGLAPLRLEAGFDLPKQAVHLSLCLAALQGEVPGKGLHCWGDLGLGRVEGVAWGR